MRITIGNTLTTSVNKKNSKFLNKQVAKKKAKTTFPGSSTELNELSGLGTINEIESNEN